MKSTDDDTGDGSTEGESTTAPNDPDPTNGYAEEMVEAPPQYTYEDQLHEER
jgi:hypothetical protein